MKASSAIITFLMFYVSLFTANAQFAHYDTLANDSTVTLPSNYIFTIGFDNNFPPFEYIDADGQLVGFNVDLMTEAMHRLKYKFVMVHYEWRSLLNKFQSGDVDILAGITHSLYFSKGLRFGIPYCKISLGVISREKVSGDIDADFLKNKKIIVQNQGWAHSYLVKHNITKNIIAYDNIEEAIKHYKAGEGDYIFATDLVARKTLYNLRESSLKYKNSTFESMGYSFAVPTDSEWLLYDLNKVIYEMKLDGSYDMIYSKWFSVSDTHTSSLWQEFLIIGAMMLCVILLFIALRMHLRIRKINGLMENTTRNLKWAMSAGKVSAWIYNVDSRAFSTLYGSTISGSGITLEHLIQLMHPNDASLFRTKIENMCNGVELSDEMVMRIKRSGHGAYSYLENKMHIHTDGNTRQKFIIGMQRDITEETVRQMEVNSLRTGLDLSMETANISAWVYDFVTESYRMLYGKVDFRNDDNYLFDDNSMFGLIHPDDLSTYKVYIKEIKEGGKPKRSISVRMLYKSEYHHYEITITDIRDTDGTLLYLIGAMKDYTEMYNLTEKLESMYRENFAILQNMPVGVSIFNANEELLYMNDTCLNVFNTAKLDYKEGKLHLADFSQLLKDMYYRIINFEEVKFTVTLPVSTDSGDDKYIECKTKYIKDNDGNVSKIVIMLSDISERVSAMEKIKKDRDEAEQSNKLKSAFLANMSHEIRTPLNAIVGFSNLLVDTTSAEEKSTYIDIINANSDLLLKLISDILDLSKIEAGFVELKMDRFDLAEAFKEISMVMEQRAVNPDVKFSAINPYSSCIINFDRSRLTQIITNFCTNAIKYTPAGFIKMGYEFVDGGIRVYVTDSGIGISEEKKNKVFMRFQKLDDFAQGTGLGLSICKAIAETAGGKVGFESVFGEGSTFWAWIPVEAEIANKEDSRARYRSAGKTKLLLAESNQANAEIITKKLPDTYILDLVSNGADAVYNLQTDKYDAVMMNVDLEIMSGIEAMQALRSFDKSTIAIAYDFNGDTDDTVALGVGFNKILHLPKDIDSIVPAIEGALK